MATDRELLREIDPAQAHELLVSNLSLPDPTPESSFWMLIPVGSPGVKRRHHTGTGIFFRRVGVVQVWSVEPAIPGINERRRQLAAVAALEQVVGLRRVRFTPTSVGKRVG